LHPGRRGLQSSSDRRGHRAGQDPRWLTQYVGGRLEFVRAGHDFPRMCLPTHW
jgi:hypothetical protein